MNGIIINIDPIILHLGAFELRWYGVAIMLAVITAILITIRQSQKKGIKSDEIYAMAPWMLISGVIGAKLFHILDDFAYYLEHPEQVFQPQGLAIWGGLAGGGVAAVIYAKLKHIPLGRLADTLAPGLLTAQIIGRFGCIINGDAYGGLTNLPWAFIYTHPNALIPDQLRGLPTHPYPVYEIIWNALVLLVIWRLPPRLKRDGLLFLSYLSLYAVGRFILTFVRQENTIWGGLQQAQIIALLTFVASLVAIIFLARRRQASQEPPEP